MTTRLPFSFLLCASALVLGACEQQSRGPIRVTAIGGAPEIVNPNLQSLDAARSFMLEAAAQGLVRLDASGEVEPALAQSWIVSDDGRRYTFRIARSSWADGTPVTAEQVAGRLRAVLSRASRNPLKPVLGAVQDVTAMTDNVLEIGLAAPRPNFLQLLAAPEMAIVRSGMGTGPYRIEARQGGSVALALPSGDDEVEAPSPPLILRGATSGQAVAQFREGLSDLVLGGDVGSLPLARAAGNEERLAIDPSVGLFGFSFGNAQGPLGSEPFRRALAMAIDREGWWATLQLAPRTRAGLLPPNVAEVPNVTVPSWAPFPLPARRAEARRLIETLDLDAPVQLRVALPDTPGHRILFALLRRDLAAIGVDALRVSPGRSADLVLMDKVARANLATWYLRQFTCDLSAICSQVATDALAEARAAQDLTVRRATLARADQALAAVTPFIAIGDPVRWSLVAPRLTGFRPNAFGRHAPGELIQREN